MRERAFLEVHYIHGERVEISVSPHCLSGWYGRLRSDDESLLEVFDERDPAERAVRDLMVRLYNPHSCTARCRRYEP